MACQLQRLHPTQARNWGRAPPPRRSKLPAFLFGARGGRAPPGITQSPVGRVAGKKKRKRIEVGLFNGAQKPQTAPAVPSWTARGTAPGVPWGCTRGAAGRHPRCRPLFQRRCNPGLSFFPFFLSLGPSPLSHLRQFSMPQPFDPWSLCVMGGSHPQLSLGGVLLFSPICFDYPWGPHWGFEIEFGVVLVGRQGMFAPGLSRSIERRPL